MVEVATLDRLFRALASGPRREILRLAGQKRHAIMQFAAELNMSQSAASKHVSVLADAGLLSKSREGRHRWCNLNPGAFEPVRQSIEELLCTPERRRSWGRSAPRDSR